MKCKKCAKEYSDEFSFCPYCGAKKATDITQKVPLLYSLPVLSDEQLEMVANELQGKNGEETKAILQSSEYTVTVYAVRAAYLSPSEKRWRSVMQSRTASCLEGGPDDYLRFNVEETVYTKSMFYHVGRSVFKTKDEAETAIIKAGYTRKEAGFWYAGV
jgi:hypothetical protein